MTIQQFKISEEGYKIIRKKWLMISVPLMSVIVIAVILINTWSPANKDVDTLPFTVVFILIFYGFILFRTLKKQKKFLMSYSVTISDDGITREQLNTPALSISSIEIREIIKTEKGAFTIKGVSRTDIIHVPYVIDNHAAAEDLLRVLAPITVNAKDPFYKKYRLFVIFPALGAMLTVYIATNKILVGICAVLVTGLLVWAFYEIRTSKNLPTNTKRISWYFLLIIASIIYVTYSKLTGGGNPWTH